MSSILNSLMLIFRLKSQIPDIKSSLEIVKEMKARKDTSEDIETQFLLSDLVYMRAKIPPTDKVCLWLGVSSFFPIIFIPIQTIKNKSSYEISIHVMFISL